VGSSAEMEQVVQEIRSAYHKRMDVVVDLRSAVRHELAELHTVRGATAAQQQQWRVEYRDGLRRDTSKLREAAQALLAAMAAEHKAASAAQRQRLSEQTKALRQDVEGLRAVAQAFLQELDSARETVADSQRRVLAAGRDRLGQTTQALRKELAASQEAMSAAQRQRLSEYTEALRQEVDELRHQFRRQQCEIRADQAKARSLWIGLAEPEGKDRIPSHEAQAPVTPVAEPPRPTVDRAPAKPVATAPEGEPPALEDEVAQQGTDDLTVIAGIGPAMQRRLRQAEIDTYAKLAGSTPEALAQSLGEMGRLAKVDDWIAAAQELLGES